MLMASWSAGFSPLQLNPGERASHFLRLSRANIEAG